MNFISDMMVYYLNQKSENTSFLQILTLTASTFIVFLTNKTDMMVYYLNQKSENTSFLQILTLTASTFIVFLTNKTVLATDEENTCQLPRDPNLISNYFMEKTLHLDSVVSANTIVKFKCKPSYMLSGASTNFCRGSQWNEPLPTCQFLATNESNTCQLPRNQAYHITDITGTNTLQLGSVVSANTIVKIKCKTSNTFSVFSVVYCKGNQWNEPFPICQNNCSTVKLTKGLSTTVNCELDGRRIICDTTVPPRTVAHFSCATGFTPQSDSESDNTRLHCNANGEWSSKRMKCKMQCGKVALPTTKFARGGRPTSILEVPWQVGIYRNFEGTFQHICGGTIISPRLVISAAHCFWNEAVSGAYSERYYKVVAGKTIRDFEKEKDQYQASALRRIVLEDQYTDHANNYRNDIAVLLLETALKFSPSVSPVCLRFERNANQEVETDTIGKFASWGITENPTAADEIQSVTMTTISNSDCTKQLQQYNCGYYDLPDCKFCLKEEYGKSVHRGDSGGGYVQAYNYEGKVTHYLIGVISHAPAKDQDCAIDGVVALTNVNYFKRLIENLRDDEMLDF